MNILIDIGHPAHVHYFKNFIEIMQKKGHVFLISARNRPMVHYLLQKYNLPYRNRGKGKNSVIGKLIYMIYADLFLLKIAIPFKPDLLLSFASPYAAQSAWFLRKPHIVIDDTENAHFGQFFYKPFSSRILSPTTFSKDFGKKHIKFNGYMELSYLSPKYFTPDDSILSIIGVKQNEPYVILRFVSWFANHDIGHSGISIENKIKAVTEFSKYAKVFITSECALPNALKEYQIKIPPEKMHDAIAYSSMIYGESATMASEAAVLGIPAIFINDDGLGYTFEEEHKYNIVFNFTESPFDQAKSILKGIEILQDSDIRKKYQGNKDQILKDKIDVTAFLVWFIENYPKSAKVIKITPDYPDIFE